MSKVTVDDMRAAWEEWRAEKAPGATGQIKDLLQQAHAAGILFMRMRLLPSESALAEALDLLDDIPPGPDVRGNWEERRQRLLLRTGRRTAADLVADGIIGT